MNFIDYLFQSGDKSSGPSAGRGYDDDSLKNFCFSSLLFYEF